MSCPQFSRLLSILIAILFTCPQAGLAAIIIYHGDATVHFKTQGMGNEAQIGDTYYWQFSMDDSAIDNDAEVTSGEFLDHYHDIYFVQAPNNLGTWNPLPVPLPNEISRTTTYPVGGFNVICGMEGDGSAVSVYGDLVTHFGSNTLFYADINDTGVGQTWAEQVSNLRTFGVIDFGYGSNPNDGSPEIVRLAINNFGVGRHPSISPVPEPSSLACAGICFLGSVMMKRPRRLSN